MRLHVLLPEARSSQDRAQPGELDKQLTAVRKLQQRWYL